MSDVLTKPSKRLRGPIARGLKSGTDDVQRIDREGGDRGAGLIRGASIIVEGEALGHEAWVDGVFLDQVAQSINATGDRGVKARFTHPSLSGDGLGTMFARAKNASVENGRVVADLHMTQAGHETPDGDLAAYVMDLAEQDADAFGISISFMRDLGEERRFCDQNCDEKGRFKSPDQRNKDSYQHFRLSQLIAADVVDEPAANPDGMFTKSSQRIAHEGSGLVAFALGQTSEPPELALLDVDPTRIRDFAKRYLAEHNLKIVKSQEKKDGDMAEETTTTSADQTEVDADLTKDTETRPESSLSASEVDTVVQEALTNERKRIAELTALGSKFGFSDDAAKFIESGKPVEEFRAHILGKSPEDWKASLSIQNPSQLATESDEQNASDDGSAAVAKIKERRQARFANN